MDNMQKSLLNYNMVYTIAITELWHLQLGANFIRTVLN